MTITAQNKYGKGPAPEGAPPPSAPPGPPRRGSSPRRRRLLGRVWLALLVVELAFLGTVGGSVVSALTAPGTQSTAARIAEWARNNGMSPLVTLAEQLTYQAPKVGGAPAASSPLRHQSAHALPLVGVTLPAAITTPAQPSLPGEGQWQVTATVHGSPAMAHTFLRPDATHTSYTAAASWFDPHLVRAQLHPGAAQPGGTGWTVPSFIPPGHRTGLLAAFNSGFKLADARGGFYEGGRYAKPLVAGGASMVFHADGTMTVGQWGRDVTMSPKVAAVRQNLTLLVDHGQVVPSINADTQQTWGSTIGSKKYVWRSGIGVTASGALVSVIGPRLSAHTLADLLQRAGCVRGMQLDINPDWTSFIDYHPTADPTHLQAVNLLPTMTRSPTRYNTTSARDFVTLHAR